MPKTITLTQLGWKPFFQQQLTLDELELYSAGRIVGQHRSNIELLTEQGKLSLPIMSSMPIMTVGDWILLNAERQFHRLLDRFSLFSRKAAGNKVAIQLISANVDTVFVVCSLNHNFNLNRIERYLAIAHEATVEAVVVLTKSDLCEDSESLIQQVRSIDSMLMVEAVNGLDPDSVKVLDHWCSTGKTVAFVGSSGVGKSTLVNTLSGQEVLTTAAIREEDAMGRHTTTSRSIHLMPTGGLLLDTPGMRELQLSHCEQGLEETFSEINLLAASCKFKDCQHQGEPGCSVQSAIKAGLLDERRLKNYLKLKHEQAVNSASLAEKHAKDRKLGRYYRSVIKQSGRSKKGL